MYKQHQEKERNENDQLQNMNHVKEYQSYN